MNKLIIDHCSQCDCGKKKIIVNKSKYLCKEKNHERKHGESIFETEAKRRKKSQEKRIKKNREGLQKTNQIKPPRKTYRIKQTSKQTNINKQYTQVISEIDNERELKCEGCGRYQVEDVKLSHSHIISRMDCKRINRPDLIYDKRNIVFHCMDFGNNKGCHRRHEQRDKTLLDYYKKLEFVKKVCDEIGNMELYNKLVL